MLQIKASLMALTEDHRTWAQSLRDRVAGRGDLRRRRRRGRPEVIAPAPDDTRRFLDDAIEGLARSIPEKSSRTLFSTSGLRLLAAFAAFNIFAVAIWPVTTAIGWIAVITI